VILFYVGNANFLFVFLSDNVFHHMGSVRVWFPKWEVVIITFRLDMVPPNLPSSECLGFFSKDSCILTSILCCGLERWSFMSIPSYTPSFCGS
jgi:hypothetical protein